MPNNRVKARGKAANNNNRPKAKGKGARAAKGKGAPKAKAKGKAPAAPKALYQRNLRSPFLKYIAPKESADLEDLVQCSMAEAMSAYHGIGEKRFHSYFLCVAFLIRAFSLDLINGKRQMYTILSLVQSLYEAPEPAQEPGELTDEDSYEIRKAFAYLLPNSKLQEDDSTADCWASAIIELADKAFLEDEESPTLFKESNLHIDAALIALEQDPSEEDTPRKIWIAATALLLYYKKSKDNLWANPADVQTLMLLIASVCQVDCKTSSKLNLLIQAEKIARSNKDGLKQDNPLLILIDKEYARILKATKENDSWHTLTLKALIHLSKITSERIQEFAFDTALVTLRAIIGKMFLDDKLAEPNKEDDELNRTLIKQLSDHLTQKNIRELYYQELVAIRQIRIQELHPKIFEVCLEIFKKPQVCAEDGKLLLKYYQTSNVRDPLNLPTALTAKTQSKHGAYIKLRQRYGKDLKIEWLGCAASTYLSYIEEFHPNRSTQNYNKLDIEMLVQAAKDKRWGNTAISLLIKALLDDYDHGNDWPFAKLSKGEKRKLALRYWQTYNVHHNLKADQSSLIEFLINTELPGIHNKIDGPLNLVQKAALIYGPLEEMAQNVNIRRLIPSRNNMYFYYCALHLSVPELLGPRNQVSFTDQLRPIFDNLGDLKNNISHMLPMDDFSVVLKDITPTYGVLNRMLQVLFYGPAYSDVERNRLRELMCKELKCSDVQQ